MSHIQRYERLSLDDDSDDTELDQLPAPQKFEKPDNDAHDEDSIHDRSHSKHYTRSSPSRSRKGRYYLFGALATVLVLVMIVMASRMTNAGTQLAETRGPTRHSSTSTEEVPFQESYGEGKYEEETYDQDAYLQNAHGHETSHQGSAHQGTSYPEPTPFVLPSNIKVKAVVFYGRAQFVDILDCYLQKNLVVNGGLLDQVLFLENTANVDDLIFLDNLLTRVPQYRMIPILQTGEDKHGAADYGNFWPHLTEDNTIYIKIDDDMVYMSDNAVPRIVETLIKHPEAHDIAANIINSPIGSWLHLHTGAIHPYLPEPSPPRDGNTVTDWRVSDLPEWSGDLPEDNDYDFEAEPPYHHHRFLPLLPMDLLKTPISGAAYDPFGHGWTSWAMAAQQHYSLLQNLENNELDKYYFGDEEGIWNMQYERYNINFLAIWGSSVKAAMPGGQDERELSIDIPKRLKKPLLIDTKVLTAHFRFGPQEGMEETDLLDRWRFYANEFVCTVDNQKKPLVHH